MANYYVSSAAYSAITQWAATTVYSLGQYRRQLTAPAFGSERVFKVTTAGTSGGTEPTWNLTAGATTNDGSVVWTECTAREVEQLAANWRAAGATLQSIYALFSLTDADTIYLGNNHSETRAATYTLGEGDSRHICVNISGGSMPPVAADLVSSPSAIVGTSTTNSLNLGEGFYYGMIFQGGSGSSTVSLNLGMGVTDDNLVLENCTVQLNTTGANARINIGGTSLNKGSVELINTKFRFGATGQLVNTIFGKLFIRDVDNILHASSSVPTNALFSVSSSNGQRSELHARNVGFQTCTAPFYDSQGDRTATFESCRLPAAPRSCLGSTPSARHHWRPIVAFYNCDTNANNPTVGLFEWYNCGFSESRTNIWRSSGASDGTTPWCIRMETEAVPPISSKWRSPRINKRLNNTGVSATATLEFLWNGATRPTKSQVYLELNTQESSTSLLGTLRSSRGSILDTATVDSSSVSWDCTSSRANTTAYAVGDIIKVASNSGRVFVCITAGTTAGSEPAGYATAVDGGSVVDNTATFRALMRCKASVTWTQQRKWAISGQLVYQLDSTETDAQFRLYVDPQITVA